MVYRRGRVWWFEFVFNGQRVRESSRSRSKNIAIDASRKRRRELEEGFHGLRKRVQPTLFSVAAQHWLELKRPSLAPRSLLIEKTNLHHLLPIFGKLLISDIQPEDISDYQQRRMGAGASPKTVNLEIGTIRGILRRNKLWAQIQQDVRMLPINEDIGRAIEFEEEQKLIAACLKSRSRCLHPAVVLALHTGMRYSDVRLLTWQQVNLAQAELKVGKSKTSYSTGRVIPLSRVALAVMIGWAAQFPKREPSHYAFPTERYGAAGGDFTACAYNTDPSRPIGSFKKAWERAKRQAGVKCRFHDLRHTACTRMLEAGAPFSVVASIMGWSPATTIRMAKRYGHIGQAAQREAVAAISKQQTERDNLGKSEQTSIN
jgi:integrase